MPIGIEEEEEVLPVCERCESSHDTDTTHVRSGNYGRSQEWCEPCAHRHSFYCSDCDEIYSTDYRDPHTVNNDNTVCTSCYESYDFCADCGTTNDVSYNDDHDAYYCDGCDPDSNGDYTPGTVYSYHQLNPANVFGKRGNPPDGIYYGVELEVETDDRYAVGRAIGEKIGHFTLLSRDGSLGDDGLEIISAPASFEYHKEHWPALFPTSSMDALDSCGMHVHVSKQPLGALQIGKIVVFINSLPNLTFIEKIAGRGSNTYNRKDPNKTIESYDYRAERYDAVNVTNTNTIEFRIFASTTKQEIFFKNLEFVHAVVQWTKSATQDRLGFKDFVNWVNSNRQPYPNLHNFLVDEGYLHSAPATTIRAAA